MSIENVTQAKATIAGTSAYKTLASFFDDGEFMSVDSLAKSQDTYAEVVAGYGTVDGVFVYAFAQNPDFCGGAMSKAQAAKLTKIYDLALKTGAPVVGFYDSKGGRLDEGNALLNGYGEVLNRAAKLSGVVPQISVILGDCLGTGALNASCADFVIACKESKLSLDTTGKDCDADTNAKNGVVSVVADSKEDAVAKARELVTYLPLNNIVEPYSYESAEPEPGDCIGSKVADAGSPFKLNKEFGDIARTALARIDGKTVGFVNTLGGTVSADDAVKIAKFVRFCDAFSLTVITFVNADGFGDIKSAAKVTSAYAEATTPKISVVTGTAVGASYIALAGAGANADVVFALPDAVISPLNPEAAVLITAPEKMNVSVEEQKAVAAQYAKENLSAEKACENGYVDDVVAEDELRKALTTTMYMLSGKRVETLSKKHSTI
ncbi:MAG: carboxyl transferase domain-containing protein [Ruminococcus sp.]|jgi:acetyl-CoA carboxylase carboxyltransferase component|nr:carboxyl transferase domain-containing protein [Ruminococcus sp.]